MERKQVLFRLDSDLLKELKKLAIEKETSIQEIFESYAKEWVEKAKS
ncbi:ribbon-helix-helix protein, CopG family [Fodinisporobacter ferrooxydans]|uniref:Ribbon-helix-helix protein, CopG family n=1 Tax=Fodinisporobacter ferrooxydans TaxID=2901836 RepID=A0ABY4CMW7_9BACL|nr:ribbon-helix-helix protein, CopG family [Alicyclobacillaceae bacterium MYW30-H2]